MSIGSQLRYQQYLNSDHWRKVSDAVKSRAGYKCQVCNSPHDLNAHHRTYENRGNEMEHLDDLICMCRRCHGIFHGTIKEVVVAEVAQPPVEKMVLVTAENHDRLSCTKEPWHWMMDNGINPRKKGWAKRAIGHTVPARWMRGAGRKNC